MENCLATPFRKEGVNFEKESIHPGFRWRDIHQKSIRDLNKDGTINILDLVIVAGALSESKPDLNGNGIVNILDLVQVANAF